MELVGPLSSGPVLGLCLADDSANLDSTHVIKGRVVAVYAEPVVGCLSGTTTLTLTTKNQPVTILDVAVPAAAWFYPRTIVHLNTTGAPIANQYSLGVPIHDVVNVAISDAEVDDYMNVYLLLE